MKYLLSLVVSFLLGSTAASGQILFDANFENGRLDTAFTSNSAWVVAPVTNLHYRVTNALNQAPIFKIYDSVGFQLRSYHHMVYRYENEANWQFFDTAYKNQSLDYYHFYNLQPFTKDTVYIAYWYPYTYSDLEDYLNTIATSPYLLNNTVKSTTLGLRNLYGYEITDTNYANCYKTHVVITARQHPIESINGYFIEGLTNYLLYHTDSIAQELRRNFQFFVYPMLNPDGVYIGSGQNLLGQGLNREWEDSLQWGGTPEIDSIRPVIWQETQQKVDWSIDIHANPGSNIPYYWWGYTAASPVPAWQINSALNYVQAVANADTSSPMGNSSFQNNVQGNGVNSAKTAANWFRKTFNAIAFTFEPTSEPMGFLGNNQYTINELKAAGQSLAVGFYAVQDSVPALGGRLTETNNLLRAEISGGYPPHSYSWSGPLNGNADTLLGTVAGRYTVTVTDSLGCVWRQSLQHTPLSQPKLKVAPFTMYPNPAKDILFFEGPALLGPAQIEVYDLFGQLQFTQTVYFTNEKAKMNLATRLNGFYLIKVKTNESCFVKRVLIMP